MSLVPEDNPGSSQQVRDHEASEGPEDQDVRAIKDTCDYICSTFIRFNGAQGLPEDAQDSIKAMNRKLTELLQSSQSSDPGPAAPTVASSKEPANSAEASNESHRCRDTQSDTDTESEVDRKFCLSSRGIKSDIRQPRISAGKDVRLSPDDILSLLQRLDTQTIPKPEVFNSTSGESFELFLQQFEEYCSHTFKGSSSLWISELGRFLQGEMQSALQSLRVPGDSYDTVKANLLKWRHDTKDVIETETRDRFNHFQMNRGESLRLFAARLEHAFRLAYPRRNPETGKTLRQKYFETVPSDFAKHLQAARSFSRTMNERELTWTNITAIASQHNVEHPVTSQTSFPQDQVDSIWVNYSQDSRYPPGPITQYEDAVGTQVWHSTPQQSLERSSRPRRARSTLKNVTFEEDHVSRSQSTPRGEYRHINEEGGDKLCYYCHKAGHIASNCWRRLGLCLVCGARDHRIAVCPQRRMGQPGRSARPLGTDCEERASSSNLN